MEEKNSGLIYFNWTKIYDQLIDTLGEKEVCYLFLARDYLTMGRKEEADAAIAKISPANRIHLQYIMPIIESNNKKYKDGCRGGRPIDYRVNVDKCLKLLHKEFHNKELSNILIKWFEYLNKNKVSTKKEILEKTISEFPRLTRGATDAIDIIKANLKSENLELDFDILKDLDDDTLELDE